MVVQRAYPQPPGSEWKAVVAQFLLSSDQYGKANRIVKVIRALLPQGWHNREFFIHNKKAGYGLLHPSPEVVGGPDWPSTLELHRCALRCEKLAEETLRAVGKTVEKNGQHAAMAALGPHTTADLQAMWAFGGGLRGQGLQYWPQLIDPSHRLFGGVDVFGAKMYPALVAMQSSRAAAFSRQYLVPTELHWGLPYLCKLFFLKEEAPEAQPLSCADVKRSFEALTSLRVNALQMDRGHLLRYARDCLAYLGRLSEIAELLGVAQPDTGLIKQTLSAAPALPCNPQAVRCRISEEARELQSILVHLGIASSPAAQQAEALTAELLRLMSSDSHQLSSTRHLVASPSLPTAMYDPGAYLRHA